MALLLKMTSLLVFLPLILIFNENRFVLTVETQTQNEIEIKMIGSYPEYTRSAGVNLPECGMRYVPTVRNYTFEDSCYKNKKPMKTLYDIEGNNLMYEERQLNLAKSRVFNGLPVALGEAPFTVLVAQMWYSALSIWQYISTGIYEDSLREGNACTGTLITFEWVLTAAHCQFPPEVVVWAGSNARLKGERRFMAKGKWFAHPGYTDPSKRKQKSQPPDHIVDERQYDIALLKVNKPFKRKTEGRRFLINTACLPTRYHRRYDLNRATYFGFGLKKTSTFKVWKDEEFLLKGNVQLIEATNCYMRYCAHFPDDVYPRPCPTDSGGPLIQNLDDFWMRSVLIGVTRGGSPGILKEDTLQCAPHQTRIGIWISVPMHIDWILETINNN